jgi:hypothetical protein
MRSKRSLCKPKGNDDLGQVYGDALAAVQERVPAGTVQYENPMHVHRSPQPGTSYRRVLFVAWDHNRFVNASLTPVFLDSWREVWADKETMEACPIRSRKRAKRK